MTTSRSSRFLRWPVLLCLPLAVVLSEGLAWWWMHPQGSGPPPRVLTYDFPADRPGHKGTPISTGTLEVLQCDRAVSGRIEGRGGRSIELGFLEWNHVDRTGISDAFGHSPDVCMATAGHEVEEVLPSRTYRLQGTDLVFDVTLFRDGSGRPFYVYKAPWTGLPTGLNLLRDGPRNEENFRLFRLQVVAKRWNPTLARVLMAGVGGCSSEEEAWQFLSEHVLRDLQLEAQEVVAGRR